MFRWFSNSKPSTQVQPYRPVVEGLEGRRLMSATLLDTNADAALEAASHGTGAGAGKVSMQDFHFVTRNNSASPTLFATGGGQGAGKVSMQDVRFLTGATGSGAGAGKVSMQDFHFVMKHNSSSPTL
jgi:type VI protein secretion system component Hcp